MRRAAARCWQRRFWIALAILGLLLLVLLLAGI
jgi:hypothetical protein